MDYPTDETDLTPEQVDQIMEGSEAVDVIVGPGYLASWVDASSNTGDVSLIGCVSVGYQIIGGSLTRDELTKA